MSDAIELRQLRYFLAVAEAESFTRAAQRLRISQPSVSQQVARLERILGTALFRRAGKRVQLTEAGAELRAGAEVVLRRLEGARDSVREVAGLTRGHVELGVIPALHMAWVPAVLERLAREHPGITVGVQERSSSAVETELEAGRLDLGFGLATHASPGVRYERLVSQPFSLIVSAASRLLPARRVALGALRDVRFVLPPTSFDMRRAADEVFRAARLRPRVAFEIGSIDSVLATVAHAGTPTLLPAIALRGRESLRLSALPLAGRARPIQFGLLWPAGAPPSPAARAVAAALREHLRRQR